MKKLLKKDKKNRKKIRHFEKTYFVLKNILKNNCYSKFVCWQSFLFFSNLSKKNLKIILTNWCVITGSKKRINKFYNYSRIVFFKLIKKNQINCL